MLIIMYHTIIENFLFMHIIYYIQKSKLIIFLLLYLLR